MQSLVSGSRRLSLVGCAMLVMASCAGGPQTAVSPEPARPAAAPPAQDQAAPSEGREVQASRNAPQVVGEESLAATAATQQTAATQATADARPLEGRAGSADSEQQQALLNVRRQDADRLQRQLVDMQARPTQQGIVVTLSNVLFKTNGVDLLPSAATSLDRLAAYLKDNPASTVQVEGYTDRSGSADYNIGLSQRRAEAVRQALVARGIDPTRIQARGYGQAAPVANNDTAEGRQMNRRVEVVISDSEGHMPQASGAPR
jgi:outer membrane protein OmpA-like peptidoglycan-associated protein